MQVEEFLEHSAEHWPGKTALVCGARRLSYEEVESQCNRLANGLLAAGLARWDRVAVYLDNSVEAAVAIFAILKAAGVFLVLNPTTKAEKLAYVLNDCRATVLVTSSEKLGCVRECLTQTPHLKVVIVAGATEEQLAGGKRLLSLESILACASDRRPAKRCIDIDLAALIYTSGSTGKPKGVMVTHLNIVSAATSITSYLENTCDDVILNFLPLSFDYGLYQLLMAFKIGGTLVLERSFAYFYPVVETLVREQVTGLPLVPTIASILLQHDLSKYAFPHLRYITNTAAALPIQHISELHRLFPHVKIYSMYGLTECKRVSYLPPDQIEVRPGSVGHGMPNEEVYIVDENGNCVGPGVVGELVVRGANVMKGYWDLPEETDRALRPGPWPGEKVLYTGDLFTSDAEGYLYWVGRKDDIIKSRGEKVSPREVEEVLHSLAGVAAAAVVGVPDEVLGSAIKAYVTLAPGARLSEQDVLCHCRKHLEDLMVPKFVEFCDRMPTTPTGKISKRALAGAGVPE